MLARSSGWATCPLYRSDQLDVEREVEICNSSEIKVSFCLFFIYSLDNLSISYALQYSFLMISVNLIASVFFFGNNQNLHLLVRAAENLYPELPGSLGGLYTE